jgi:hypothetical protein
VLKLIVDHKRQDYKHLMDRNSQRSGKKPPLEQKNYTLQMFLAGFYLTIQLLKITRGWEAEGLEEEAKVCFIHFSYSASSAPPSSTIPGPP